jgi:drug/metabolite transporter (DMT)-like permease
VQSSLVFGFTACLFWGVAEFCARGSSRLGGTFLTLLAVQVVAVAAMLAIALPLGFFHLVGMPLGASLATVLISVAILGAYALLYRAFALGNVMLVSPIVAGFAAVTALLALISGERPSAVQLAGIVVTLSGVILASSLPANPKADNAWERDEQLVHASAASSPARAVRASATERARIEPGHMLALLAMLVFGIGYWALHFVVGPLGGVEVAFIGKLTDLVVLGSIALAGAVIRRGRNVGMRHSSSASRPWYALRRPPPVFWLYLLPTALCDTLANIAYNLGIAHGLVSVVVVLSSLYTGVTVMLAWVFLRERLRRRQWLGVAILVLGIVLVNI